MLKFFKLRADAQIPLSATRGSVGYDLVATHISKRENDVIYFGTGLVVIPPEGFYTEIVPRSSIAKLREGDHCFLQANSIGIIDADYRGELIVPLRYVSYGNTSEPPTGESLIGTRIAQILVKRIETPEVEEVFAFELTERGAGGFGSTGR